MTEAEKEIRVAVHSMSDPKPSHFFNDDDLKRLGIFGEASTGDVVKYAAEDLLITILFDMRKELDALKSNQVKASVPNYDDIFIVIFTYGAWISLTTATDYPNAMRAVKEGLLVKLPYVTASGYSIFVATAKGYRYMKEHNIGNVD